MIFQRKYNTALSGATLIRLPIIKRAVVDYAVGADWTPAAGDVKVSIDGGAAANIGTLPTAVAMGNTAYWGFTLSGAETTGKNIVVTVSDSATKAVEDQAFVVETFGHASAMYPADISAVNTDLADVKAAIGTPAVTIATDIAGVQSGTNDIQTRLPTTLVGGRIDASVGAMAAGVITDTAIASDAITDAKVASDVTIASVTGAVGSVTGAVGSVTGAVGSVTGAVGSVTGNIGGNVAGTVASVVGAVGSVTANVTFSGADVRAAIGMSGADLDAQLDAILADTAEIGAAGAGLTALASASNLATVAGYLDTEIAVIMAVTNKLDTAVELDGAVYRFTTNALEQAPTGGSAPTVGQIADEVQTRTIAAVTTVNGLAANTLTAAALAADAVAEIQSGLATASALATVQADTDDIQTRLPAALVGGRIDASVGAVATGAINAGAIAADAIGASELAADAVAEIAAGVRTELATELARIDVAASTRLATASYTAPDNAGIATAVAGAAAIFARTDVATSTRAAAGDAMALTAGERGDVADKILIRNIAGGSDGGRMVRDALRPLRNRSHAIGGVLTAYEEDDLTIAWTAALGTAPGDPLVSIDPT